MYSPQNYKRLLGTPGFSDQMLHNHFTLYEGYVKNTNTLVEFLDTKEIGSSEYAELQRRLGWEWNGMRLHELYFGNMKKEKNEMNDGALKEKIQKIYGSVDNWKKNFIGVGTMRGIGWVILYLDTQSDEMFNVWITEHDAGHFSGCKPLLVMDVFEHAYMLDYGLKKIDYMESFWNAVDWSVVEGRL